MLIVCCCPPPLLPVTGTFWMFTGFSLLGLLFFVLRVPETKGKSLEQVEELFMTASELEDKRAARATSTVQNGP